MTNPPRTFGFIKQNETPPLRAYIEDVDGTPLQQAAVDTVKRVIFDLDSSAPTVAIDETTLEASDVIIDTLQEWDVDSRGYNFMDVVTGGHFDKANRRYEVHYRITTAAGNVIYTDPFELKTIRTF